MSPDVPLDAFATGVFHGISSGLFLFSVLVGAKFIRRLVTP